MEASYFVGRRNHWGFTGVAGVAEGGAGCHWRSHLERAAHPHVVRGQIRAVGEDLRFRHAIRQHRDDRGDRDPQAAHAGDAAHAIGALRHGPVSRARLFFSKSPKAPVYSKAISSRHFDAIGAKTCQLMLRGRYNDILHPDVYYIAIDRDFCATSTIPCDASETLANASKSSMYVHHVLSTHTYAHRAAELRNRLEEL